MKLFTPLVLILCLVGCESAPKQRVSVGFRVHVPDPINQNGRHRAAKIPIDVTVEYEVGGERNQPQICDHE